MNVTLPFTEMDVLFADSSRVVSVGVDVGGGGVFAWDTPTATPTVARIAIIPPARIPLFMLSPCFPVRLKMCCHTGCLHMLPVMLNSLLYCFQGMAHCLILPQVRRLLSAGRQAA